MKPLKTHIPNLLTSCNFLCGAVAIILALEGFYGGKMAEFMPLALLFIIVGAVFDFLDGMSARLLHVSSPIGKELDSLADATTFGLAPAVMIMAVINEFTNSYFGYIALIMAAASIIRLAKFNLDQRQTTSFIGLATPANALFWAGISCVLILLKVDSQKVAICFLLLTIVSSYLMNAEIPFFSLKFHDLKWKNNRIRYIFLIISALLYALGILMAFLEPNEKILSLIIPIPFIIIVYITLVIFDNLIRIWKKTDNEQ